MDDKSSTGGKDGDGGGETLFLPRRDGFFVTGTFVLLGVFDRERDLERSEGVFERDLERAVDRERERGGFDLDLEREGVVDRERFDFDDFEAERRDRALYEGAEESSEDVLSHINLIKSTFFRVDFLLKSGTHFLAMFSSSVFFKLFKSSNE